MATQQAALPQGKASLWTKEREQQLEVLSDGSLDDDQPEGWKEYATSRWRAFVRWSDKNKEIVDFVLYFCFLLLFTIVALGASPGENLIEHNEALRRAVGEQEFFFNQSQIRRDYSDVDTIADFWNWISGPFIATVLSDSFPDQYGFFYRYFRILGLIRLRQVRVTPNSCIVPAVLSSYVSTCYAGYADEFEDVAPYGPVTETGTLEFIWRPARELNEGTYWGRSGTVFPGSGYNTTIPLTRADAARSLAYLKENNWIDLQTRVVFIDFVVYNANVNLLTLVKIATEFPPSSGARPFISLRTAPLRMILPSESDSSDLAIEISILVIVSIYIAAELIKLYRQGWSYWAEGWHYFDWFNYITFLAAFTLRLQPFYYLQQSGFPPRPDEFINYESPMWAVVQWKNVIALNSVLTWLRLFKFMRFVPFMQLLVSTLAKAMGQLVAFGLMLFIVYFGFALAHLLAFGGEVEAFRTLPQTLFSLFRVLLNTDYFDEMWEHNRLLGPLFYFGWTLLGFFVLLNMFVAILNDAIEEVKPSIPHISLGQTIASFLFNAKTRAVNVMTRKFLGKDHELAVKAATPAEHEMRDAASASQRVPTFGNKPSKDGKRRVVPEEWEVERLVQMQKLAPGAGQLRPAGGPADGEGAAQGQGQERSDAAPAGNVQQVERRLGNILQALTLLRGPDPEEEEPMPAGARAVDAGWQKRDGERVEGRSGAGALKKSPTSAAAKAAKSVTLRDPVRAPDHGVQIASGRNFGSGDGTGAEPSVPRMIRPRTQQAWPAQPPERGAGTGLRFVRRTGASSRGPREGVG